jgi:hypothetical protein
MKKLIMIFLAAAAVSCGESNRSSERDERDDMDNTEQVEPDTTTTDEYGRQDSEVKDSDTSSVWDRDRDNMNASDSLNNKK